MKSVFVAAVLSVLFACTPGHADECTPKGLVSLDLTPARAGGFAIPVAINGKPYRLIVQTAQPHSYVFKSFVDAAALRELHVSGDLRFSLAGASLTTYVHLDKLAIGPNTGENISMLVSPDIGNAEPDVAGIIGTDLLQNFDVEIDLKRRKLNLFVSNPCEGRGVYWGDHYAMLPIARDAHGQMTMPMTLDGQNVSVAFNSMNAGSLMEANVGVARFGLAPRGRAASTVTENGYASASLEPDGGQDVTNNLGRTRGDERSSSVLNGGDEKRFTALVADGLTISNPLIHFSGDPYAPLCDGNKRKTGGDLYRGVTYETCFPRPDLMLGLREMEQFHLYFAYRTGKLYFTAAAPP